MGNPKGYSDKKLEILWGKAKLILEEQPTLTPEQIAVAALQGWPLAEWKVYRKRLGERIATYMG